MRIRNSYPVEITYRLGTLVTQYLNYSPLTLNTERNGGFIARLHSAASSSHLVCHQYVRKV